jgi:hypothetical protein
VRAAQRAFFEAALSAAAPTSAAAPANPASASAAAPAAEPPRFLRPGSRLDIRV